ARHRSLICTQAEELGATGRLPESHGPVRGRAGETVAVGGKDHARYSAFVASQGVDLGSADEVPDPYNYVGIGPADNMSAIAGTKHTYHGTFVPPHAKWWAAPSRVPHSHRTV